MATFSTWTALKTTILDDLASANWKTKSYTIGSRTVSFRDLREVVDFLKHVDEQIARENFTSGATPSVTFAKQGGGGRW